MIIVPKNWAAFQHYKDRSPAWIKLHRSILDDYEFSCLPVASRALAPLLWLLASEYEDGAIDASEDKLAFRLRMQVNELQDAIKPLLDSGFFILASGTLAGRKQDAIPEKEREIEKQEQKEKIFCAVGKPTRTTADKDFEEFWKVYPARAGSRGKAQARKEFEKLAKSGVPPEAMLSGARAYAGEQRSLGKINTEYIAMASTWLRARRWEDYAATAPPVPDDRDREDMATLRRQMMEAVNGGKVGSPELGGRNAGVGVVGGGEPEKLCVAVGGALQRKAG